MRTSLIAGSAVAECANVRERGFEPPNSCETGYPIQCVDLKSCAFVQA